MMKVTGWIFAAAIVGLVHAEALAAENAYHYLNKSFGYGFDVMPPFASQATVPVDGNGEEFATLQGHGKMESWAIPLRGGHLDSTIIASVKSAVAKGYYITSKQGDGKSWYEYQSFKNDQTVIVRFLSVCRGNAAAMMQITYPTSEAGIYAAALKTVRDTMMPNFSLCKL